MRTENSIIDIVSQVGKTSLTLSTQLFQSFNGFIKLGFVLSMCCVISPALSQSYFTNGSAKSTGGQCYQLTPASTGKNGSVWYAEKLDLSKNFDLEFNLNFGNRNQGADGIVFVLQTVGTKALGAPGGGLGYQGFSPSLGIEFDDYNNSSLGDLANDHIGILKNGEINHNAANSLAGPVNANASGGNIEDGKDHLVRIKWNEATKTISVWFDCSLRLTKSYDIVNNIFKGQQQVYWGFTSATGGEYNAQIACLRNDIIIPDSIQMCRGEEAQLNARESQDNVYTWLPTYNLSKSTIRNPKSYATESTMYTVTYKDKCGLKITDTTHVIVNDLPAVYDLGKDTLVCKGQMVPLAVKGQFDKILWENGSKSASRQVSDDGTYWVKTWNGSECFSSDTIKIETLSPPSIHVSDGRTFCTGDSLLLTVQAKPNGPPIVWSDGFPATNRYVSTTQTKTITAQNMCGIAFEEISVKELTIESYDLGQDTILCQGDTILKKVLINGPYTYLWSTGETHNTKVINEPGTYWFKASREHCSNIDSINIQGLTKPVLNLPQDFLLCDKEEYVLNSDIDNAEVIWNGNLRAKNFTIKDYSGSLNVEAKNLCGSDSVQIEIELKECACDLIFPNAVSPNYDGLNETFGPVSNCDKLIEYTIEIYNRWGQKVYESADIKQKWDMTYLNKVTPAGTYIYIARYTAIISGFHMKQSTNGKLIVLR